MTRMTMPRSGAVIAVLGLALAAACSEPNAPTASTQARAGRVPVVPSTTGQTADVEYVKACVFVTSGGFHPASFTLNYSVDLGNDGTWDQSGSTTIAANSCLDLWVEGTTVFDNVKVDVVKPNPAWIVDHQTNTVFRPNHADHSQDVYTTGAVVSGNTGATGAANGADGATIIYYFRDK